MVTVQVGPVLALHAPPQPLKPLKPLPLAGVAVRVTVAPLNKEVEQTPEVVPAALAQLRLPSSALKVPEPLPMALRRSPKVPKNCPLRTRRTWRP